MSEPITGQRCTATAKSTGQQCRRLVLGGGVCVMHGGRAPQVDAKRRERVALAEMFAQLPRRRPGDILADVVHTADVLAVRAREDLAVRGDTPESVQALIDATMRAGYLARVALGAGIDERRVQLAEQQGNLVVTALQRIFDQLDLSPDQRALLPTVVPAELRRLTAAQDGTHGPGEAPPVAPDRPRKRWVPITDVAGALLWLADSIGLGDNPWVRAQVAIVEDSMTRGGRLPEHTPVPPSWWAAMAAFAARKAQPARAIEADRRPLEGVVIVPGVEFS